jgi:DNA-binding PucR family transcriptional regulator
MGGWCAPAALDPHAARDALVAVGLPGDGLAGFRRSHAEAMEARRVARLGGLVPPVDYADVALTALLTKDLDQARAFVARELGDLAADGVARLADTVLEVLVVQGSPRQAAQRLGLHENTVAKRVRSAEEVLGHPIDERPVQTLAALLILRALRDPGVAGPQARG